MKFYDPKRDKCLIILVVVLGVFFWVWVGVTIYNRLEKNSIDPHCSILPEYIVSPDKLNSHYILPALQKLGIQVPSSDSIINIRQCERISGFGLSEDLVYTLSKDDYIVFKNSYFNQREETYYQTSPGYNLYVDFDDLTHQVLFKYF